MPAQKKPADKRQRRNKTDLGVVEGGQQVVDVPEPDPDLLEKTTDSWLEFWESPLATTVEVKTDLPALRRLFGLYDERERASRAFRKDRMVLGSQGQMVLNPMARLMKEMDSEIRQLEDRFGLTPMARLKLGVQFAANAASLEDLNRRLSSDDEGEPDLRVIDQREASDG